MEPGRLIAQKYRIERHLDAGGMGAVFSAVNIKTGKAVALKQLLPALTENPDCVERFSREARAVGRIDHPNVVNVYDVEQDESGVFIVMELLRGAPLSAQLAEGAQDPGSLVRTLLPVFRGVQAAHDVGVVHRDLKPENIFLCEGPDGSPREAKVVDFGISKATDNETSLSTPALTRTGAWLGTLNYMSPEQINGAEATIRSDVYALAVVLYHGLTGELPHKGDTVTALAVSIATKVPEELSRVAPNVDPSLANVVMRAMSADPAKRYDSVASFGMALERFTLDSSDTLRAPVPHVAFGEGTRDHTAPALELQGRKPKGRVRPVLVGLGCVAAGAAAWALWPRSAPVEEPHAAPSLAGAHAPAKTITPDPPAGQPPRGSAPPVTAAEAEAPPADAGVTGEETAPATPPESPPVADDAARKKTTAKQPATKGPADKRPDPAAPTKSAGGEKNRTKPIAASKKPAPPAQRRRPAAPAKPVPAKSAPAPKTAPSPLDIETQTESNPYLRR